MCIEDLRLGRRRYTDERVVATDVSVTLAAAANKRRVKIRFEWANAAENVRLGAVLPPTATSGVMLRNTRPGVEFTIEEDGNIVQQAWFAFGESGQTVLRVYETFTEDE